MKTMILLSLEISLLWSFTTYGQDSQKTGKLTVDARMAKAREAKAQRKGDKAEPVDKPRVAASADYQPAVVKVQKGPHGEIVHIGERGAKFYINKNGNRTYLSSNQ